MPESGTAIFGVDERLDFAVTGVHNIAKLEQQIASIARNAVDPPLSINYQTFTIDAKDVFVARINPLPLLSRPTRWEGRAYLRQSNGDYVIATREYLLIEAEKHRAYTFIEYDIIPQTNTTVADLNDAYLGSFLSNVRLSSRMANLSDAEILRITRIVNHPSNMLTLAGLYSMGRFPETFDKAFCVTVAHQVSIQKSELADLQTYCGSVPEILK